MEKISGPRDGSGGALVLIPFRVGQKERAIVPRLIVSDDASKRFHIRAGRAVEVGMQIII